MKVLKKTKRAEKIAENNTELIKELRQTVGSMDTAINHFEQVVDPMLIDCYIYELKAAQLRYQFLLRNIKNREVSQ